jgi:chemotaxis signal transduction protein
MSDCVANAIREARDLLPIARGRLVEKILVLISKIIVDSARDGCRSAWIRFNVDSATRLSITEWRQIHSVTESAGAICEIGQEVGVNGAKMWYVMNYTDVTDYDPMRGLQVMYLRVEI